MRWECLRFVAALLQHVVPLLFAVATDTTISFSLGRLLRYLLQRFKVHALLGL
jgi:hypothetical protein